MLSYCWWTLYNHELFVAFHEFVIVHQKAALGFEPRVRILQTLALPLGYAAETVNDF